MTELVDFLNITLVISSLAFGVTAISKLQSAKEEKTRNVIGNTEIGYLAIAVAVCVAFTWITRKIAPEEDGYVRHFGGSVAEPGDRTVLTIVLLEPNF